MTPANRIAKNRSGANTRPTGPMILKIIGKTMNTSPVPSVISSTIGTPFVSDMKPRIENTPNAVHISKVEFEAITINALSMSFEFSGR